MKRFVLLLAFLGLIAVPALLVAVMADVRQRDEEGVPGPVISRHIRQRMEQRHIERAPRLGSATRVPGGGPGYEAIDVKGQLRTFVRYTPDSVLLGQKRVPVVFALHAAKGTAARLAPYLGLNAVADRERFIVVYPQGIDNVWNDGRPAEDKGSKLTGGNNDILFLNLLADAMVADGVADPERIYLAGVSNGGFMTLTMACQSESRFAAFAAIVASLPAAEKVSCGPKRPVPLLMVNGTEDALVRYDGTEGQDGIKGNLPVPETAKFFAGLNGCGPFADTNLEAADVADTTRVTRRDWRECRAGSAVTLYTVNGGGHQAPATGPGSEGSLLEFVLGGRSRQIDSAATVWSFFKAYHR